MRAGFPLLPMLVVWTLCACESPDRPRPPAAPGTADATVDTATGDSVAARLFTPPADTLVARWAERIPAGLLVRPGACPFECCLYRTWTSTTDVPLRPEPRHGTPPGEGRLAAGEPFEADSGFVRVTGIMLVVPHDTVMGYGPGDTLLVLDYVGEGFFNLWDGSGVREVSQFWGAESSLRVAETLGRWEREWWTHATGPEGQRGWFSPDSVPDIDGADACG